MRSSLLRRERLAPSILIAALATLATPAPSRGAGEFLIDPLATYLRRGTGEFLGSIASDEPVIDPVPIDLLGLGYTPGMTLQLEQTGDWSNSDGGADDIPRTIGVFSSDNVIISGDPDSPGPDAFDTVDRISSAVPADRTFVTQNTFFGDLVTDIPEDFLVSSNEIRSIAITIPTGARYLWIAALDTNYRDNSDPDGDYRIRVSVAPEPGAAALLALGLTALTLRWRRRTIV